MLRGVVKSSEQQEHPKKAAMLKALVVTLGVVTPALEKAKVGRTTYYRWLKEDDQFRRDVTPIEDICLDFSETELHKLIRAGNPAAIFFHLKCKGKKRGYIERQELEQQISIDHTGKVATYHLPDNGRGKAREDLKEGTITTEEAKQETGES